MSGPAATLARPSAVATRLDALSRGSAPRCPVNLILLLTLGVVFAGYCLRVWQVTSLSVSGDEINSVHFSTLPFGEFWDAVRRNEPHPPLYYLGLRAWLTLAGTSELALRWPSVLLGSFGIAALASAARGIAGRRAGLGAAAILAISQFSILHAQDARMYALLQSSVAVYLAGVVWLGRAGGARTFLAVVVLAGTSAAYSHYHGLLLVVFGGLATVALFRGPARRATGLAHAGIVLLYLPWLIAAWDIFTVYRGWMAVVPLPEIARRSTLAYAFGDSGVPGWPAAGLLLLGVTVAAGTVALARHGQWRWLGLLATLSAGPLLAVGLGSLAGRPLFHERYLIVVTPALYTLAGIGLGRLARRRVGAALAVGGLGLWAATALPGYFWPDAPLKPDFRSAVAHVVENSRDDALLVMPEPHGPIARYYLGDARPTYVSPQGATSGQVADHLERATAGRESVWFLRYSSGDWDDPIARWMQANAYYLDDRWVSTLRLQRYALPAGDLPERDMQTTTAGDVRLVAATAGGAPARPGGLALGGFRWAADTPVPADAKVSLRLIDPHGRQAAALDRALVNPESISTGDAPDVWQGALPIPDDAVPGPYRVEARFYDPGGAWPMRSADGSADAAGLGIIDVEPATAEMLRPERPADAIAVRDHLFVSAVALAGSPYTPDSRLIADVTWVATVTPAGPVEPVLEVVDEDGRVVAADAKPADRQVYHLSRLRPGERVRGRFEAPLRDIERAGTYRVQLRAGPDEAAVGLGTIEVAVDASRYVRPDVPAIGPDRFGEAISLVGADFAASAAPGGMLPVRLVWHAARPPETQYTVFVHLLEESGQLVAQSDSVPAGGTRPTADWIAGEYVTDEHQIRLPASLPAGDYRVVAGLYESATGRRIPVQGVGAGPGAVHFGTVTVTGG